MAISIVIPAYEMQGHGIEFLNRALDSIRGDYEVIVSDDTDNNMFMCVDERFKYVTNHRTKGTSGNLNNAIDHATGDIIKVLFQDDTLGPMEPWANLKQWGFCTSKHNGRADHVPFVNENIKELALGNNTYGSPSAMAFRKSDFRFDETLRWLLDCEFYARMQMKYGPPEIVGTHVNITEWPGQATYTVATGNVRVIEANYIQSLYADI